MFRNKEVQISLSEKLQREAAHGVLWARPVNRCRRVTDIASAIDTGYRPINFRADKPHLLQKVPGRSTIRSIYEQANSLGLELLHVELVIGGEQKFYALQ
jgi:hypothetical protein